MKVEYKNSRLKKSVKNPAKALREYDLTRRDDDRDYTDCDLPERYALLDLDEIEVEGNTLERDEDILALALQLVCASPTARHMIMEAADYEWHLSVADLNGENYFIDMPRRTILFDNKGMDAASIGRSGYFQHEMIISLAKALRDIWQDRRYGAFPGFGPEGLLMLERVRAADIDVTAVLIAWELRGEGYHDVWRHLIGNEDGDVAMAFSNYLDRHPSPHYGKAMSQAFVQWFISEDRVNFCDHRTLEFMDDVLAADEDIGERKPAPRDIIVLSCQPDRRAYLQGMGEEILSGPMYAGLCDPINQAHFMQIMQDKDLTYSGGVAFRDSALAAKIFPEDMDA